MKHREPDYIQKLSCVLCKKTLAWMGAHKHYPGPIICPKCLVKKNKEGGKKKS